MFNVTPIIINGHEFECQDDVVEAFIGTKNSLIRGFEKPKEAKRRGAAFLLACIESKHVHDPGNRVRTWARKILE